MSATAARKPVSRRIALIIDCDAWKSLGVDARQLKRAAQLALKRGNPQSGGELTLLLTDDARMQTLNARFRGKDAPTNVLAFPAVSNPGGYLGDVAIAFGVAEGEAAVAGISLSAHAQHLAVHGVLHLLGYDHMTEAEARIMEPLEIAVLKELAIPDPYLRAARAE